MTESAHIEAPLKYDLTQSQSLIMTGQLMAGKVPLYNMPFTFCIRGSISIDVFKRAFQGLIDRCEALRTSFGISEDGGFTQTIHPHKNYELTILDESSNPDFDSRSWAVQRSQRSLDWTHTTFDSVLIKLSESRYVWYLNVHHLVTDALSFPLMLSKLSELYEGELDGTAECVTAFPHYRKYIDFENDSRNRNDLPEARAYWNAELDKAGELSTLYGRPFSNRASASRRVCIELDSERLSAMRECISLPAHRSLTDQLSKFNFYTALLGSLISRISGEKEITIGSPVHNRITPDHKNTPGLFIEFFPITNRFERNTSLTTVIQETSRKSLNMLKNVRPGTGSASLSRSFSVVLNLINLEFSDFAGMDIYSEWIHPGHIDPGHALRLHVYKENKNESEQLLFDFNRSVFAESSIDRFRRDFTLLFDEVLKDPDRDIASIELSTATTTVKPDVFDDPEGETVLEAIRKTVDSFPSLTAASFGGQSLTHRELDDTSNRFANYLLDRGLQKGERVLLSMSRSIEYIACATGVLKAGGVFVPVPTDIPQKRKQTIISHTEAAFVVTEFENEFVPENVKLIPIGLEKEKIDSFSTEFESGSIDSADLAYIIYTSGSTGAPNGVCVSHGAFANYIGWAAKEYAVDSSTIFPFFTSIGFDLTLTSIFLPLVSGGSIRIYPKPVEQYDTSVLEVFKENAVSHIKLTPSHLSLARDAGISDSQIRCIIVGGENFETGLARDAARLFDDAIIFNEYGPTEATVGCIVHRFDIEKDSSAAVPVGRPISNMKTCILDENYKTVAPGVKGQIFLSGRSLASGYWNNAVLTSNKFIPDPQNAGSLMYATGDIGRVNPHEEIEYLGRADDQVKINGNRVELSEIEAVLSAVPGIERCAVRLNTTAGSDVKIEKPFHCIRCGLPSTYPGTTFNDTGVCSLCIAFEIYGKRTEAYFKSKKELRTLLKEGREDQTGEYDCLVLLSGGKDSTYVLAQLVEMGCRVLAFTLDNGFISDQAKENILRVVKTLGVDHIFGSTPSMNKIFVDSLERHSNVCNGCFKTIYTLATSAALRKDIPFVVTGLSRGQFFETRLTEELFLSKSIDPNRIDETILDARKAYHQANDAVKQYLNTSFFEDEDVFERVRFIDFYRYADVTLDELYEYLDKHLPWIRPTDTGRSTNCLINKAGIAVHRKERGYSNYAFPYSWDVRMGHKTRNAALAEVEEEIDDKDVARILNEIGYVPKTNRNRLTAFLQSDAEVSGQDIREKLSESLPSYMIPTEFVRVGSFPLTSNGKIDYNALTREQTEKAIVIFSAPEGELEELVAGIWSRVLNVELIGVFDDFLSLGGQSLSAIRIIARLNNELGMELPVTVLFSNPTVRGLASAIEVRMKSILEEESIKD